MIRFISGFILGCLISGIAVGFVLSAGRATTDLWSSPVCASVRKEERRLLDMYLFLLSRDEIRQEEDRRKIALEFQQKLAVVEESGAKKNCPVG